MICHVHIALEGEGGRHLDLPSEAGHLLGSNTTSNGAFVNLGNINARITDGRSFSCGIHVVGFR